MLSPILRKAPLLVREAYRSDSAVEQVSPTMRDAFPTKKREAAALEEGFMTADEPPPKKRAIANKRSIGTFSLKDLWQYMLGRRQEG